MWRKKCSKFGTRVNKWGQYLECNLIRRHLTPNAFSKLIFLGVIKTAGLPSVSFTLWTNLCWVKHWQTNKKLRSHFAHACERHSCSVFRGNNVHRYFFSIKTTIYFNASLLHKYILSNINLHVLTIDLVLLACDHPYLTATTLLNTCIAWQGHVFWNIIPSEIKIKSVSISI